MAKKAKSVALYRRLLSYTFRHPFILIGSMLAIALSGLSEAGLFYLLKPILDEGFVGQNRAFIQIMPWLIVGVFLLMSLFSFLGNIGMQWIAQKVVNILRSEMFDKLLTLPLKEYNKSTSGAYLSKLTYDVNQLMTISSTALVTLIRDVATIIGLVTVMFIHNWKLSLIIMLITPFIALLLTTLAKVLRSLSRTVQSEVGELNHITEETIRGHREIKLFSAYEAVAKRFRAVNHKIRKLNLKIMVFTELASPLSQFLLVVCVAILIRYSSQQALEGSFTVGGFLSMLAAMIGLLNPIKRLTRLSEALQRGLAGAESVFALIDAPLEENNPRHPIENFKGRITFEGVSFSYNDDGRKALDGIDLTIDEKETIALVGASGSGKSTFANLLARFYLPTEGQILLDGVPLNEIDLHQYRSYISYVGQNVILFADTIANNIGFGTPNATREEIIWAAEQANARTFIEEMPDGFETLIGQDGARLSGGQRQRIAIARALLKDAPILILDEATSSLDNESEHAIQEAINALSADKTTLIIAHRLSTIEHADRIVVFKGGEIVESGTHEGLLAAEGEYAKLYQINRSEEE